MSASGLIGLQSDKATVCFFQGHDNRTKANEKIYQGLNEVGRENSKRCKCELLLCVVQLNSRIRLKIVRDMATLAPMLSVLGYDPNANPPKYVNAAMEDFKVSH